MEGKQTRRPRTSPKYDIKRPPDRFTDEHERGFVSKHNFSLMTFWTSVQPSLLTYFQVLRICLFSPSRQRDRKSERQNSGSSARVKYELQLPQQDVFTARTLPTDLPWIFGNKMVIRNRTPLISCTPNFCQASPQTPTVPPVRQQVVVHSINLQQKSGRGSLRRVGKFARGGKGGKSGSEDSDRSEGSCPFSTSVLHPNPPHRPGLLSEGWRQCKRLKWTQMCTTLMSLMSLLRAEALLFPPDATDQLICPDDDPDNPHVEAAHMLGL